MDSIYGVMDIICNDNKMSQQELDSLYMSLGVSSKSVRQQLIEEEEELERLKQLSYYSRFMDTFSDEEEKRISIQQAKVDELRKIKERVDDVGETLLSSMTGGTVRTRVYPSLEVRNKVFLGNIDLAKKMALKYFYGSDKKFAFDDLFQMACEALLSASYYYVPLGEAKFSTYAIKCIENKLKREIYPKKKKGTPKCGVEFLKDEKDVVRHLKMFLDGGLSLQRLNKSVIEFNRDIFNLGEDNRTLPRPLRGINLESYKVRYDQIVKYFVQAMKDSNLNDLISDEDRQFVSRLASYKNISGDNLKIWTLRQYVNLYMQKLTSIIWYLEIEQELIQENAGRIPQNEEILKRLNDRVRKYNAKVRGYPKEYWRLSAMKSRILFADEYGGEFGVDLASKEERSAERKGILYEFDELSWDYENFLTELECKDFFDSDDTMITCHFKKMNIGGIEVTYVDSYDDSLEFDDNSRQMKVSEFKKLLREQIDFFYSDAVEDLLDKALQRRRKSVLEQVDEKNKEIFQYNRAIFETADLHRLWGEHKRLYTEDDLDIIQGDIGILYLTNEALISSERGVMAVTDSSLEDSVICNLFLEDYYKEVARLDVVQREILLNWFDENGVHSTSARDIATKLGITPNKVYKEKTKALRKLATSDVLKSYNEV